MVEEYDSTNRLKGSSFNFLRSQRHVPPATNVISLSLIVRKWRRKTFLGGQGKWEYEVGEPEYNPQSLESDGIHESASNVSSYIVGTRNYRFFYLLTRIANIMNFF